MHWTADLRREKVSRQRSHGIVALYGWSWDPWEEGAVRVMRVSVSMMSV